MFGSEKVLRNRMIHCVRKLIYLKSWHFFFQNKKKVRKRILQLEQQQKKIPNKQQQKETKQKATHLLCWRRCALSLVKRSIWRFDFLTATFGGCSTLPEKGSYILLLCFQCHTHSIRISKLIRRRTMTTTEWELIESSKNWKINGQHQFRSTNNNISNIDGSCTIQHLSNRCLTPPSVTKIKERRLNNNNNNRKMNKYSEVSLRWRSQLVGVCQIISIC